MTVGSQEVQINSKTVFMPLPPRIEAGLTMVPLRFLAESCGYYVNSSTAWNDKLTRIYVTPYTLINDSEIASVNMDNFTTIPDTYPYGDGFVTIRLKHGGMTPAGIQLSSSILDVLEVYGVPRTPYRNLNYPADWTGKLVYWGSFIPQSDRGAFWEFSFERGALSDLTIAY